MAEAMTPNRLAVQSKREASGSRKQRFSGAWWLKVVGLTPLGIIVVGLLVAAAVRGWRFAITPSHHNLHTLLAVLVITVVAGALVYLGWRKPGLLGALLVIAAPVGALLGWVGWALGGGSTGALVFIELLLAGVPLVSALFLIVAARLR